jgi:hypothetical protein
MRARGPFEPADDEVFIAKSLPFDRFSVRERVALRECHKKIIHSNAA